MSHDAKYTVNSSYEGSNMAVPVLINELHTHITAVRKWDTLIAESDKQRAEYQEKRTEEQAKVIELGGALTALEGAGLLVRSEGVPEVGRWRGERND